MQMCIGDVFYPYTYIDIQYYHLLKELKCFPKLVSCSFASIFSIINLFYELTTFRQSFWFPQFIYPFFIFH